MLAKVAYREPPTSLILKTAELALVKNKSKLKPLILSIIGNLTSQKQDGAKKKYIYIMYTVEGTCRLYI